MSLIVSNDNCWNDCRFTYFTQDDFGYAVTKLIFLNERPMSASSAGANLVSCNASGWVRKLNLSHAIHLASCNASGCIRKLNLSLPLFVLHSSHWH